jgi:hypothetical protein
MAVPLERGSAIDLRQATQSFDLQKLGRPLQLGEVLLDDGIRQIRQDFRSQPLNGRPKLAHVEAPANICSSVAIASDKAAKCLVSHMACVRR